MSRRFEEPEAVVALLNDKGRVTIVRRDLNKKQAQEYVRTAKANGRKVNAWYKP